MYCKCSICALTWRIVCTLYVFNLYVQSIQTEDKIS